MTNIDDNLSNLFDTVPVQVSIEESLPATVKEEELKTDYEFARGNIKELIRAGNNAIDSLGEIAKISEHPRAFEVFSGLIKNLADLNKDLLDIQAKNQKLTGSKSNDDVNSSLSVNQAVFVGSTKELIQLINKEETK